MALCVVLISNLNRDEEGFGEMMNKTDGGRNLQLDYKRKYVLSTCIKSPDDQDENR